MTDDAATNTSSDGGRQLATVSMLAASVAHEINNPANFVQMNLDLLRDEVTGLEQMLTSLQGVPADAASQSLAGLLQQHGLKERLAHMRDMLTDSRDGVGRILSVVEELAELSRTGRGDAAVSQPKEIAEQTTVGNVVAASEPPSQDRRLRILLIDDESRLRRAFRRVLEPVHDVVEAGGGAEALEILALDRDFDVILCDLMMPGIDGPSVHEALAKSDPEMLQRMVFATGGAFTVRAQTFLREAAPEVLQKPISRTTLQLVVQRIMGADG